MRNIKILGLVAVAALVVAGFVGATSASAAVLCKTNSEVCPAASVYPSGTAVEAKLNTGTNANFFGNINTECTESTIVGKTTAQSGVPIAISSLSLSGCKGCKVAAASNLPYNAEVSASGSGNGAVSVKGGEKGSPSVHFEKCTAFNFNCTFGAAEVGMTLEGGNAASLVAKGANLKYEGGTSETVCGPHDEFSASYQIVHPKPVYVSQAIEATVLCNENAIACPEANVLPKETEIKATATNFALTGNVIYMEKCESTATGKTLAQSGSPSLSVQVTSLTLENCGLGVPCTRTVKGLPYEATLNATGSGNGQLTMPIQIELSNCGYPWESQAECTWSSAGSALEFNGGSTPQVLAKYEPLSLEKAKGKSCGSSTEWSATYSISNPSPVWVTNRY